MFRAAQISLTPALRPKPLKYLRSISSSAPICNRRYEYIRFGRSSPRPKFEWNTSTKAVTAGIVAFGGVYWFTHLEQVPETGRWRFMNTSLKFEEKIGKLAQQQAYEEHGNRILPPSHPLSRHVRRVVTRILAASNLGSIGGEGVTSSLDGDSWDADATFSAAPGRKWDVIVVNDQKMVNAEAVPGLIIVYTGILPICQDEQGLAAVLSHEIGHVVARHTAERMSSGTLLFLLMIALQTIGLDFGLSDLATQLLFQLPNSRTQELEADTIGLKLMSQACFDPRASLEMFRRLGQMEAKMARLNVNFLRTHPSSETRVKHLEEQLPDAYGVLAANPECAPVQDSLQVFRDLVLGGQGGDKDFWAS